MRAARSGGTIRRQGLNRRVNERRQRARHGETADRLTRPASQAQRIDDAPGQRVLQQGGEIGRQRHWTACGACEHTPLCGAFYHIPIRTQPDSPTGQPCVQIGDHEPVRRDHEADQLLLRLAGPRDGALPHRPALLRRQFLRRDVSVFRRGPAPQTPARRRRPPRPRRTNAHGRP